MDNIKTIDISVNHLIGIVGVPGIGKSSLLIFASANWAMEGKKIWFYSLSKSRKHLYQRAKENLSHVMAEAFTQQVLILEPMLENKESMILYLEGALCVSKPDCIIIDSDSYAQNAQDLRRLASSYDITIITTSSMDTPIL